MRLDNETPFAARLLRTDLKGDGHIQAIVVVKATFACDRRGHPKWVPAVEQIPIVDDRLDTPFGVFHGDIFARKEGIDLCVLGTIRISRPVRTQRVTVDAGAHSASVIAFGDRYWNGDGDRLIPTEPVPFTEMPLAFARAYGGSTEYDDEVAVFADNPAGIGYYLDATVARGNPLRNIEAVDGPPIQRWNDQPPVAGFAPYPFFWGIRAREGIEPREGKDERFFPRIKARLNNHALPSLVMPAFIPGDSVRIRGMRDTELIFEVPKGYPSVIVEVDGESREETGRMDGIFIWADADRLTITFRIPFRYTYDKGVERRARLVHSFEGRGSPCPE